MQQSMFNPSPPATVTSRASLRAVSAAEAELFLERHAAAVAKNFRRNSFSCPPNHKLPAPNPQLPAPDALVLLTNGIGGMARMCVDLGRVNSKYDCVLGANLNPTRAGGPPRFRQTPPRLG